MSLALPLPPCYPLPSSPFLGLGKQPQSASSATSFIFSTVPLRNAISIFNNSLTFSVLHSGHSPSVSSHASCRSTLLLHGFSLFHSALQWHHLILQRIFYRLHNNLQHILALPLLVLLLGACASPSWPLPLPHALQQCHFIFQQIFTSSMAPCSLHSFSVFSCAIITYITISIAPHTDTISIINKYFTSSTAPHTLHSCVASSRASRRSAYFSFMALLSTVRNSHPTAPSQNGHPVSLRIFNLIEDLYHCPRCYLHPLPVLGIGTPLVRPPPQIVCSMGDIKVSLYP